MEDGLSSVIPSNLAFDIPISTDHYDEEAEAADALKREKQIEENLQNAFDDLSNIADDDDDDDDDSHSSDEESINSSHQKSKSYAEHSSVKASFEFEEQTLPPNEISNVLSSHSQHQSREQSHISDSVSSHHSDGNHSNVYSDHRTSGNHWNSGNISEYNSDIIPNGQQFEFSDVIAKDSSKYNEVKKSFESASHFSDKYQSKPILNSNVSDEYHRPSDLEEEYMKLQLLFKTRGKELKQIKREEMKAREAHDHEVRSLKLKLTLIEGEKDRLTSSLQESQKLISEYRHENNVLKGKLAAIELQYSAEKEAKENAMSKLQSAEITIQSLEQQLNSLARSENTLCLRDQSESIVKDLKLRHQKEVLQLKEEIDKLQGSLNSKINESENLTSKISQLQQKYEDLQVEKSEMCNKLSASLEASQRQCQNLLESGTISELSILRLQVQHLQEEKSKLEKLNSSLKDEVKSLKSELQTCETLKKLTLENDNEGSVKTHVDKKKQSSPKESFLKDELQRSLKCVESLRIQNNSLKEELDELKHRLPISEEKAKLFESRLKKSEEKARNLKKKLEEVLPAGSVPGLEHEKKVNVLENELMELRAKLHDVTERLKSSSANEEKLYEDNKNLKASISEMVKSHTSEKINAIESCREKCLEIHESAINKLKEELNSKADKELKTVCINYENKISELQKEIKYLNEGLYDAKSQYIKVFEENKSLQMKIDSISIPKEREEIEKEVKKEYEQKLRGMKQLLERNKSQYESYFKSEFDRVKKEWTKEKMIEIEEFVNTTKQQLEEEFSKCVQKEKSNVQSEIKTEKEKIQRDCEQKINDIKLQCEADKNSFSTKLRESFQLKWKDEIKDLQQSHQNEIESMKKMFENKILAMENEIRILKGNLYQKSEESEDIQNLKKEFANQKHTWEKEKIDFMNNEQIINQKLTSALEVEKNLLRKVKKYHKYVSTLKKQYQGKVKELQTENEKLKTFLVDKEKELYSVKEQYKQHNLQMELNLKKKAEIRNSGCQTEEKLVSHKTLLNVQDMFIQCLKKIADDIKTYMLNSRKRSAEQLNKALSFYHDYLISKIYQDVLKDSSPVTSNIYIPCTNGNIQSRSSSRDHVASPNAYQLASNPKTSNSSPIDSLAAGDSHSKFISNSDLNNVRILQNARSTPESGIRLEDLSFDFVPITMPDSALTSTKMPEYYIPTGLFNRQNIFPERDSPLSIIK